MARSKEKKLTAKEDRFCHLYVQSFNGAKAARETPYGNSKTKDVTFRAIAYENLTKPHIKERIRELLSEHVMQSEEVLARLRYMAEGFDPGDFMELREIYGEDKEGERYLRGLTVSVDIEAMKEAGYTRLIKEVRNTSAGPVFEFYDQHESLVQIGRAHGLFLDRTKDESPPPRYIVFGNLDEVEEWERERSTKKSAKTSTK